MIMLCVLKVCTAVMSSADLNAQAHKVVDSDWMSMKYCSSAGKNTF